jgi:hypothetical protein
MAQTGKAWSLEADYERYGRLLAHVKSGRFWISDKPGRPTKAQLQERGAAPASGN